MVSLSLNVLSLTQRVNKKYHTFISSFPPLFPKVQQFEGTQSYERVIKVIYHLGGTLEGLSIGTPKTINIPFGTNGKLMNVGIPIFKHTRVVTVLP